MTDVHSNPDPNDDDENRLKAALLARGSWGAGLWFLLLAGIIVTLTLVANRCGDDDSAGAVPTPTEMPESTVVAAATVVPEATATPEPTAAPTATPQPTATPAEPTDVTLTFSDGGIVLTGVVSSQTRSDELVALATELVGGENVDDQLVLDETRTEENGTLRVVGSLEEATGNAALDAVNAVLGSATLDTDGFELIASTDVVQQLNELFRLNPVQFATGSADILPESTTVLDEVSAILADAPALRVEVSGHTDSSGDPGLNQTLSLERSESVRTYLVDQGVAADQLTAVGRGDTEPIADNETPEGRQQNRRIEFALTG